MDELLQVEGTTEKTMTSLEISKYTGKKHTHVLRDIDSMLESLDLSQSKYGFAEQSETGEMRRYRLPKDLTLTLVSGYNAKLRKAIIDKWLQLEATQVSTLPTTYREALYELIEKDKQLEEAVKTKAYISDKKTATALNTASQAVKKANKLEIELDKSKEYCTVKRMQMLNHGQRFKWKPLKDTSIEMGIPPIDIYDANYGTVKGYHKDVWEEAYGLTF